MPTSIKLISNSSKVICLCQSLLTALISLHCFATSPMFQMIIKSTWRQLWNHGKLYLEEKTDWTYTGNYLIKLTEVTCEYNTCSRNHFLCNITASNQLLEKLDLSFKNPTTSFKCLLPTNWVRPQA